MTIERASANEYFLEATPLRVADHIHSRDAFVDSEAAGLEVALFESLEMLPPGGLLPIDFAQARVSSEAARRFLRRGIFRLTGGELPDRFIVFQNAKDSRYNLKVMLKTEGLVAVVRTGDATTELIGAVDPAVQQTYDYLKTRTEGTAKQVATDLGLANISTATNRLSNLAASGLVRRMGPRPAIGGGREYFYAAVA
ncbi:MAG: hypothetical protein ABIP58_04080 [Dehalococcoidia bacterium]